jgi:RNA-directed DNA polymerase
MEIRSSLSKNTLTFKKVVTLFMSFPFKQFIETAKEQSKSQEFIDACIEYAEKLTVRELPVLFSLEHLAIEMGIQSDYLRILNGDAKGDRFSAGYEHKYERYNYFKLRKRNGTYREIMAPSKDLKYILDSKYSSSISVTRYCKGFRKKISIFDNAKVHENADVILKVDLLKFYDTITEKRVYGIFKAMGYARNLSYSLAKLTTAKHRPSYWDGFDEKSTATLYQLLGQKPPILPQGAPTSPMLANIAATNMDKRFEALAKKMKFKYSRYADDLTFSIAKDGQLPSLKLITRIVNNERFFINTDKTSYMKKGSKQYVTGLTTTNGVNVSKIKRKEIAEHIYYCRKFGVQNHLARNAKDFPNYNWLKYHNWLYGHICFIKSINKKASEKLFEILIK